MTSWHLANTAAWQALIPPLLPTARPAKWLEIGSYAGSSAEWLLSNLLRDDDTMTCVDHWRDPEVEGQFDSAVARFGGRVTKVKSKSAPWLSEQRCGMVYDVIYIDGDHDASAVLSDAVLAWPLLRVGGVMMFDDYRWRHPHEKVGYLDPGYGIDGFLSAYRLQLIVLHSAGQVIVTKRRENQHSR